MRPETSSGHPLKLHYFPRPHPDEVIGSLLIRASRHWGMSIKQFNRDVLGVVSCHMPMLMSGHLPRLAELTGISADVLLDQHTVFPYVTAFLPDKEANQLRRRLLTTLEDGLKPMAALIQSATTAGAGWRFCPMCSMLDVRRFGESYWHRSHLLPGVLICHDHGRMLLEISRTSHDRLALPHDVTSRPTVPLMSCEKLKMVAVASTVHLGDRQACNTQIAYRRLAEEAGYRISYRAIAAQQLALDLALYFGKLYLARFGCAFTRSPANHWPGLMIRDSVKGPFAPLKHVLLQVYLEQAPKTAKEIHRKPPGKARRNYTIIDAEVTVAIETAVAKLAQQGKTVNAWDLLKNLGVWPIYRHNRHVMPETKATIESFRQSNQCSWRIQRRSPAKPGPLENL